MNEPTWTEVKGWERQLNRSDFRNRLLKMQRYVFDVFDEHRERAERGLIRTVIPRPGIKSLESIIHKIWRKRNEGDVNYDFQDLDDLIGVKVVCPYPSSSEKVSQWLMTNDSFSQFTIDGPDEPISRTPAELEMHEALELLNHVDPARDYGYWGYNFVVKPNLQAPKRRRLSGLVCEVQIKTVCSEAWDAMTHATTYKRQHITDTSLQRHALQLSRILQAVDAQGEIVKEQVDQIDRVDRLRKKTGALLVYWYAKPLPEALEDRYAISLPRAHDEFSAEDIEHLEEAMHEYVSSDEDLSREECQLCTFLALKKDLTGRRDPQLEQTAISFAEDHVAQNPEDPAALDNMALTLWALDRLYLSVFYGERALELAQEEFGRGDEGEEGKIEFYRFNLAYWAAEAANRGLNIATDLQERIQEWVAELLQSDVPDRERLDTAAFVTVVFGGSLGELQCGLELAERISQRGEQTEDWELALTFADRVRKIAYSKLAEHGEDPAP